MNKLIECVESSNRIIEVYNMMSPTTKKIKKIKMPRLSLDSDMGEVGAFVTINPNFTHDMLLMINEPPS